MLNKRTKYGDDWEVPSAEHPAGACKNRSAPGAEDGSYFEKAWANDLMAFPGAIMTAAGYSPNGTEDTAVACQVFDALVNKKWTEFANYEIGTIVKGSNGKRYYCNKATGRDSTTADPVSDATDTWREYPYSETKVGSIVARKHYDGSAEIFGQGLSNSAGSIQVTLPITVLPISFTSGDSCTANHVGTIPKGTNVIIDASTIGQTNFIYFKNDDGIGSGNLSVLFSLRARWA